MNRPLLPAPLALAFALAFTALGAAAQQVRVYRAGEAVDPQEVVQILQGGEAGAPAMKMRSIRLLDDEPSSDGSGAAPAAVPARTAALSLPVQFAFDSAQIEPAARPQLDAIAEGIRRLPAGRRVVIEGHTDATGPDAYNEALSQRRAAAVRQYLVTVGRIESSRLYSVGFGKFEPLPGRDPFAPENRRVQFRGE